MDVAELLQRRVWELVQENRLADEEVTVVTARPLKPEEAIGNPTRQDFPLLKGKEVLVEATFRGSRGQAYTRAAGNFQGTLREVLDRPLKSPWDRTLVVATANAVLRHLGVAERTVHCRDREPDRCAGDLVGYLRQRYGNPRVAVIGLQPAMVAALAGELPVRVTDLDPENVGQVRAGVEIEGGEKTDEVIAWADVVLATGSTVTNGSICNLAGDKPTIFYGTTIAGAAALLGLHRYCPYSH